jgi:hypothetical protein
MYGSQGLWGARRATARLGALALAVALCLLVAAPASAGRLVGKDGKVYACYKTRGKAKGSVRLVAKKAKCRKGEKKISWSVTGPPGGAGENGESGSNGNAGEGGGPGATGVETRVNNLVNRVESLEDKLKGITNLALTEVISKLQGISGAQLQQAISSIANVKALCTQASALTQRANELSSAIGGLSLNTFLTTLGGLLQIPTLPAALPAFNC